MNYNEVFKLNSFNSSCLCSKSLFTIIGRFTCQPFGHVITRNLNVFSNRNLRDTEDTKYHTELTKTFFDGFDDFRLNLDTLIQETAHKSYLPKSSALFFGLILYIMV